MKDWRAMQPKAVTVSALDVRFRRPLMSYFLRRVSNHAEAEDLTQRVFVRVMSAGDIAKIENPEAYVFTIASNLLKDRGRKAVREGLAQGPVPDFDLAAAILAELAEDRSPERVLIGRESLASALSCLDQLGEKTRAIFILYRLENMKQREIADLYGTTQKAVEKHIMKAMLHLTKTLGPL